MQAVRRREQVSGQAVPGWGMLLIGLVIGLFVAFLVYLDRLDVAPPGEGSSEAQAAGPSVKPRFEFYSILPELEVVIPDILDSGGRETPAASSATPGEEAPVYFLQAGSFKRNEEADRMKANLALLGLQVVVQSVTVNDTRWHRVRVGPLTSQQALREARGRLRENDIDFMVLKTGG